MGRLHFRTTATVLLCSHISNRNPQHTNTHAEMCTLFLSTATYIVDIKLLISIAPEAKFPYDQMRLNSDQLLQNKPNTAYT